MSNSISKLVVILIAIAAVFVVSACVLIVRVLDTPSAPMAASMIAPPLHTAVVAYIGVRG